MHVCYHVTGQFDMVMLLAARDLDHLSELIRSGITSIPVPICPTDDECVSRSRATSALGAQ